MRAYPLLYLLSSSPPPSHSSAQFILQGVIAPAADAKLPVDPIHFHQQSRAHVHQQANCPRQRIASSLTAFALYTCCWRLACLLVSRLTLAPLPLCTMADPATNPEHKVSRYRSQRQKAQRAQEDDAANVPEVPHVDSSPQDDSVARSKSRYHRKRGNTAAGDDQARATTSHGHDDVPFSHALEASSSPPDRYIRPTTANAPPSRHATQRNDAHRERRMSPPTRPGAHELRRFPSETYDSSSEQEHTRRVTPSLPIYSQTPPAQVTGELFPPPRPEPAEPTPPPVRRDGPPTSDQIKATKSTSALPRYLDESEDEGGCFGLFKRKKEPTNAANMARPVSDHRPKYIKAGGGGVMPGSDAPVSAVNAGDRRVLVECGKSRMMFPVTPTTTCVDLIKSASTTMSERIDVKSAVLLEHFGTVGIQRPLRRYESVRNVMNSWDSDRQNCLILVDPATGSSESELSMEGAPKKRPEEAFWLLTYSQRPGKWEKRFITLKSDGQITCQKDLDKPRDQVNVCHLSDYDIYTPTPEKIKKKIKPPKKMCLAIKSQEKSSMFETTENFVHFFCSNDRRTADDFYDAVQNWRSWYLVHVLGDVKKPQSPNNAEKDGGISTSFTAHGHKKMDSTSSHYQLGSFKPLMDADADQIGRRPSQRQGPRAVRDLMAENRNLQAESNIAPTRRPSTRKQQGPPKAKLAEDEPLVNLTRFTSADDRRPSTTGQVDEFSPSGLLGRSVSHRQREAATRTQQLSVAENNHLNRQVSADGLRRQSSTRRNIPASRQGPSGDIGRSNSTRAAGKPLVDLTPKYPEPAQHNPRVPKGRGHHPDNVGPGGLIDAATSPDDPLGIPASTDWRGRNHVPASDLTKQRSNSRSGADHQRSLRPTASQRRPPTARPTTARAAASDHATGGSAFTGEGLLASSQEGWGGGTKGRGVIDGSRAKGPMVDFSGENRFAQGSLLNRVEREQGVAGPVIER